MTTPLKPRPLLWEEGMTYDEYKLRKSFYNGTAQPTSYGNIKDGGFEDSEFNYPTELGYMDLFDLGSRIPNCKDHARFGEAMEEYASCSDDLFKYSLYGIKTLDI